MIRKVVQGKINLMGWTNKRNPSNDFKEIYGAEAQE